MDETKVAYVFPGQGSQWVGMGQDLYEGSPSARETFEEANRALGFPHLQAVLSGSGGRAPQNRKCPAGDIDG